MATFKIHSVTQKTIFEVVVSKDRIEKITISKVGKLPVEANPDEPVMIEGKEYRVSKPPPEPSKSSTKALSALMQLRKALSSTTATHVYG